MVSLSSLKKKVIKRKRLRRRFLLLGVETRSYIFISFTLHNPLNDNKSFFSTQVNHRAWNVHLSLLACLLACSLFGFREVFQTHSFLNFNLLSTSLRWIQINFKALILIYNTKYTRNEDEWKLHAVCVCLFLFCPRCEVSFFGTIAFTRLARLYLHGLALNVH